MSDSGNQRSISEDLKLALIDSALWEKLKGPLKGNWYSQGILCTSVLDWTFETQDCFDTASVTLVFKALSKI